jgi:hypothetical protein
MMVLRIKTVLLFGIMVTISANLFSQELSKKEMKRQADSIEFSNTLQLIETKQFIFSATQALPQGSPSIVLSTGEYSVRMKNDTIVCYLPFYGRAYSADLVQGGGFDFSGVIDEYEIAVNSKKHKIEITMKGRSRGENYRFHLSVASNGSASLSASSDNKSTISYWGDIIAIQKKKTD